MSLPTEDSDSDLLDFIDDDDEEEGDSDSVFVISSDSTANEEDSESEAEVYTPRQARKSPRKARGSEVESEGDLDMLSLAEELDDDEEGDEIMLEAAIKESLASAFRGDSNGAGPSTSRGVRNSAAAKRAAAAEKRLATERNEAAAELDEIFDGELSEEEEVDEAEESDDEEPAPKKKKGGQPAKSGPRSMTIRELKRQRRLERQQKREELAPLKAAEARYRKTLGGRKLTYAEKSSVALWHHHPELETCWGDLEKKIAIVQPVKADQPEQLKVKLLPFQQESLYWMRKQEKGVWKGGMLADEMG
jgi:DNA repair protein RAD16